MSTPILAAFAAQPSSWCDHALAERSRDALAAFLTSGAVRVGRTGRQSYGRTVARVSVNGMDPGEYLIAHGLARRWAE